MSCKPANAQCFMSGRGRLAAHAHWAQKDGLELALELALNQEKENYKESKDTLITQQQQSWKGTDRGSAA